MRTVLLLIALAVPSLAVAQPPKDESRIKTTPEANSESLQGAAQSPLRDLNVVRTKIPPILLEVMHDPYQRPSPNNCRRIAELIRPLDEALGTDLDVIPAGEDEDLIDRGKTISYGVMAGVASSLIPFRGGVRMLTGAERHDRLVSAAITSGNVRRAYLKGLGESKGCNPPATPTHVKSATKYEPPRKGPKYPVR
ncbi:hypothetical protein [Caulobacter sp. NIBR2454]|uniref:hypothetical protein n=1 Tax=Caulobacter sp. NIBR2454 TaxID=3015996 RepID=UPI0022B5F1E1|nr:hypothetical protein [Caulobacter sp. NIBR2454]